MPGQHESMTLLGPSLVKEAARTLYVYRDDGTGRFDGSYVKKYTAKVEKQDLLRDLSPGRYVLMESGGKDNKATASRGFVVTADKEYLDAGPAAAPTNPSVAAIQELMLTKALRRELQADDVNPLDMIERVASIFLKMTGAGASNPLEAFLQGADYKRGEGDGLAAAITAIADASGAKEGDGQMTKLVNAVAQKIQAMDKRLQQTTELTNKLVDAQVALADKLKTLDNVETLLTKLDSDLFAPDNTEGDDTDPAAEETVDRVGKETTSDKVTTTSSPSPKDAQKRGTKK